MAFGKFYLSGVGPQMFSWVTLHLETCHVLLPFSMLGQDLQEITFLTCLQAFWVTFAMIGEEFQGESRSRAQLGGGDALGCSVSLKSNFLLILELRVGFGSKHEFSCHLCFIGEKAVEEEWCFKRQCMSPFASPPFLKSYPEVPWKLASVPLCCDCFSSVHCLLYILLVRGC